MEYIEKVLNDLREKDYYQKEFLQAVEEVLYASKPIFEKHPEYEDMAILERLVEPERIIKFKVPWTDDKGKVHVNRGYRVQFNGALGPYKGGLRFHPSVTESVIKFLGFEQIFKNALTNLSIGGGKGGSDFDPKGKSNEEIKRFCQSFILELSHHIGADIDVPAGDMGVSGREIGYMYGYYKRIKNASERGVLTGKGISYGGSLARTEATGYGLLYFFEEMMKYNNIDFTNNNCLISGSGNVAIYAAFKAQQMNMNVIGMSDSKGYILDTNINVEIVRHIKEDLRKGLEIYPELAKSGTYHKGSIYDIDHNAKFIFPCATQNEINKERAQRLINNNVISICEGANMPSDNDAIALYLKHDILFAPGKAANAGGVATSALEMAQNSSRLMWTFEEVDSKLKQIMINIHNDCIKSLKEYNINDKHYVVGANLSSMQKVIDAMIQMGDY